MLWSRRGTTFTARFPRIVWACEKPPADTREYYLIQQQHVLKLAYGGVYMDERVQTLRQDCGDVSVSSKRLLLRTNTRLTYKRGMREKLLSSVSV